MSEEKFWPCNKCCKLSIRKRGQSTYWIGTKNGVDVVIADDENYCSYCGSKRPPEPKKLAQILFEAWQEVYPSSYGWDKANEKVVKGCQAQAEAVVNLVKVLYNDARTEVELIGKLEEML